MANQSDPKIASQYLEQSDEAPHYSIQKAEITLLLKKRFKKNDIWYDTDFESS